MAKESTEIKIKKILANLSSVDASTRRSGLLAVEGLFYIDKSLAARIENLAVKDTQPLNRAEALKILRSDLYREFKNRWGGLSRSSRSAMVEQIENWEKEGLMEADFATALKARYGYDLSPKSEDRWEVRSVPTTDVVSKLKAIPEARPVAQKPKEKGRSLGEILLSQGSINIALYLGTFLILAAAMYYTAFSDSLRIPILAVATALFGGGAFGLKRRLPSASFVLFVVYSLLIPILGIVIRDNLELNQFSEVAFWIGVNVFLAINWAIASHLYASKLFSLLSFGSFNFIPFQLTQLFRLDIENTLLLASLTNLVSMAIVVYLHRPKQKTPSDVVFPLSQVGEIILLLVLIYQLYSTRLGTHGEFQLLVMAGFCFLGILYHLQALKIERFPASEWSATVFLFILPLPLFQLVSPAAGQWAVFLAIWASLFAVAGHWLDTIKKENALKIFSTPMLFGSALLFAIAAFVAFDAESIHLFAVSLLAVIVYTGLTTQKVRSLIWGAALIAFLFAYLSFYDLPFMEHYRIFEGFIGLWLSLIYLTAEILVSRLRPSENALRKWCASFGWAIAVITMVAFAFAFDPEPTRTMAGFTVFGVFVFVYSLAQKRLPAAYVSAGALAAAVMVWSQAQSIDYIYVLFGLAVLYYAVGTYLPTSREFLPWKRAAQISGLILSGFVAYAAHTRFPAQEATNIYLLVIALFLAAQINERKGKILKDQYRPFLQIGSLILSLGALAQVLELGSKLPSHAALALALFAVMFALFARFTGETPLYFIPAALVTGSALYLENFLRFDYAPYVVFVLALFYYFAGRFYLPNAQTRKWARVWQLSGLILAGGVAYYSFSGRSLNESIVILLLVMILFLSALYLEEKKGIPGSNNRSILITGTALFTIAAITQVVQSQPLEATLILAAYATLFTIFAGFIQQPKVLFLAAALLTGSAYLFAESYLRLVNWFLAFAFLAFLFIGIGFLPTLRRAAKEWSNVLRWSGLGVASLMCALAWLFRGPYIVTAVALMATLFALEAWQRRKVWLAILADLIYIEAYFLALLALNISEPQFFTTGAALLGIILHYLLRKMGTPKLTFLAGLTSQFILLGGSFIQMVATENLTFFLLLFFQAMVVIAYGTVVRSRSLVLAPIGFLVLGVSAIVYKAYRDRLSLLVVSCTGFLLLMLGISGLFLRERIGAAGRRVSAVFSEWSA